MSTPEEQKDLGLTINESSDQKGYFFCLGCKGPCAEIEDVGEQNITCEKCGASVQWIPPRHAMQNARYSPSKRDEKIDKSLIVMCFKGFHQCLDCGHITNLKDDKCILCGSIKVIWNKPVLAQEIVENQNQKPK